MIEWVYPATLYGGLPLLAAGIYLRWAYYKEPCYTYSALAPFAALRTAGWASTMLPFLLRALGLTFLVLALARPRVPDERSLLPVQGIDIMMVLDVSGSMQLIDDRVTEKDRFTIAKNEAREFIYRRINDPIGLVLFGMIAVTRCPLTLDKNMLGTILSETDIEVIPSGGTVLADGMILAANRLKKSTAASRIMIVLTDGAPSPNDNDPRVAIDLARQLGIKVYTIGIGSEQGGWINDPVYGWRRHPNSGYNEQLLRYIADKTDGRFFSASNAAQMAHVYDTIDQLERSEQQMPVYARYYEYFLFLLWAAIACLLAELILTTYLWRRL